MIKKSFLLSIAALFLINIKSATSNSDSLKVMPEIFQVQQDDPVLLALDQLLTCKYFDGFLFLDPTDTGDYQNLETAVFDDAYYRTKLYELNQNTPFDLTYNQNVRGFINLYANRKSKLTAKVIGLSQLYFPLFEEILDKHNLPLELKYLAVVESALNPFAKSKAGATGMWQFMYNTGKLYNLEVTSYTDDRMDVLKSTEAACKYLKFLHSIYGNWELALAAYNCGPGNVNKAIRRAGGKRGYWEIYDYLPKETRGYVPAFIAVNYIMNNYKAHNITPLVNDLSFFHTDTVAISGGINLEQIAYTIGVDYETLRYLNPVYKTGYVPLKKEKTIINLPADKVGLYIHNESLAYNAIPFKEEQIVDETDEVIKIKQQIEIEKMHLVKKGETLGAIAARNNCSVKEIQQWNNLKNTNIFPGQKLKLITTETIVQEIKKPSIADETAEEEIGLPSETESTIPLQPIQIYYKVQPGDTLYQISNVKGVSIEELKKLNKNIDIEKLEPGTQIIIGTSI